MAKVIDYKKVNITDEEYNYYKHLVDIFTDSSKNIDGKIYFKDLFDVDKNGYIILIKTDKSIPWAILFFVQQLMLSQRLRIIDTINQNIENLDKRIKKLEGRNDRK